MATEESPDFILSGYWFRRIVTIDPDDLAAPVEDRPDRCKVSITHQNTDGFQDRCLPAVVCADDQVDPAQVLHREPAKPAEILNVEILDPHENATLLFRVGAVS